MILASLYLIGVVLCWCVAAILYAESWNEDIVACSAMVLAFSLAWPLLIIVLVWSVIQAVRTYK